MSAAPARPRVLVPAVFFALTVLSMHWVGATMWSDQSPPLAATRAALAAHAPLRALGAWAHFLAAGASFALPLLAILVCHEAGHWLFARRHGVPASLPLFLPMPFSPFGTFGAVIGLDETPRTRNKLFDVAAAGPLAGLLVAVPVTWLGLRLSPVRPDPLHGAWQQEGNSLVYLLLKRLAVGPIPAGSDVQLHPMALAGWAGLMLTMLNLIPYGQLDGGHVSYALLGERHQRNVRWVLPGLLLVGVAQGLYFGLSLRAGGQDPWALGAGYTQGLNWLFFAAVVGFLHRGTGGEHPLTAPSSLSPGRRALAVLTLVLFVALFTPVPLRAVVRP